MRNAGRTISEPRARCRHFFLADVRDGLGPYLAISSSRATSESRRIRIVLSIATAAGILARTYGRGADRRDEGQARRSVAAGCGPGYGVVFPPSVVFILLTVVVPSGGMRRGTIIAPALPGNARHLSTRNCHQRIGRIEFDHAGNTFTATVAALPPTFGALGRFLPARAMSVGSLLSVLSIPDRAIKSHRTCESRNPRHKVRRKGCNIRAERPFDLQAAPDLARVRRLSSPCGSSDAAARQDRSSRSRRKSSERA